MPTVVSLLTRKLTLCKAAAEAVYIRGGPVVDESGSMVDESGLLQRS